MESILTTIKLMLGITAECTHFDPAIIGHINTALMRLCQLGVGPPKPIRIHDDLNTWDELLLDSEDLEGAKTYIYLEVKRVFDPPATSFVLDSMKREADKLEWCLNAQAELR